VSLVALPSGRTALPGSLVPAEGVSPAPAALTASLRDLAGPGDRVLNPQSWGSWFEYAVPDVLVAVDSRIELFRPEVWATYESIIAGRDGWQRALADWRVTHVVVEADATGFKERLVTAGWDVVHDDADGALLVPG